MCFFYFFAFCSFHCVCCFVLIFSSVIFTFQQNRHILVIVLSPKTVNVYIAFNSFNISSVTESVLSVVVIGRLWH